MVKKFLALSFAAMIMITTPPPFRRSKRRLKLIGKCSGKAISM